jgi:hypothetical protein
MSYPSLLFSFKEPHNDPPPPSFVRVKNDCLVFCVYKKNKTNAAQTNRGREGLNERGGRGGGISDPGVMRIYTERGGSVQIDKK